MLQANSETQDSLRINALEHLIDEEFDREKSCHAVCYLLQELFANSDNEINRRVAELATKALDSTVEFQTIN
jgi:hypothetical protein